MKNAQVKVRENGRFVSVGRMDTLANCRMLAAILQTKGYVVAISY